MVMCNVCMSEMRGRLAQVVVRIIVQCIIICTVDY
jgi:hypothetical protein